jgi:HD-GYP domain-containing protein (c-di-GMP phosphodiesterase class II)
VRKQVSVQELQFGMYVAELDRPWRETPFAFQGFVLSTQQQLDALRTYCKTVWIDTERTGVAPAQAQPSAGLSPAQKANIEEEIAPARAAHQATEASVRELLSSVRVGRSLDWPRVRDAVATMTESVLRNPDALLLLSQLKEQGEYAVAHALDVSIYMITFGRFLELEKRQIEFLGYLGLLQDIGKTRLPRELIDKRGRLTAEEFERAKLHVNYTVEILRASAGLPADLARSASLHHERSDGSGYPNRLQGQNIGMIGSIAAIVDSYDAMTVRRPYAEPQPPSAAISTLYKLRGLRYDAALVEQFIRCIGIFPVGSFVKLNSGEVAIVIAQNAARRLQPRVMVVRDAEGQPMRPQKMLDLSREPKAFAGEPYRILTTLERDAVPSAADELFMN